MMGGWKWIHWIAALLVVGTPAVWAYEYDTNDSTQGAGKDAPWRVEAQWDQVDETSTKDIHQYTTDTRYISPMVSFVPEDPNVPSPRDFLGYTVGTEGILTRPDDEIKYFEALAAASPHVSLEVMGPTEEGREMHLVIVTDAGNQADLEKIKANMAALADPRKTTPAQAADLIKNTKPVMHITAGLHSPETGPPEMVMELAYRVAVSKHPDIEKIRKNVILLITPVTDVDGRAKVVDWYYRYLKDYDTRDYMPSMSPPYWGKYSYHDNNRDGIQMSQLLTKNYMKAFMEWHPVYSLDLHESVPLLYVSGGTGPYNPSVDPLTVREWQWAASYEMTELQKYNMPGVWTWGFYTGWNPSYLLWITNNHNSMGRFYETFGNLSAKTMERDLTTRKFVGKSVTEKAWYRADPPDDKVMWSLRNNTNYMQSGVLASLKLTSNNGAMLLDNFYRKGVNGINAGKKEDEPHGWVIPQDQPGKSRLAYLINQLRAHAIEVHRATSDFSTDEGDFKTGDFVVRLDQPYGRHATNLLNDQLFPKDAEHRPYDDVSWTLGRHYKVDTVKIEDASIQDLSGLALVNEPVSFPGTVGGSDPVAFAVKHDGSNTLLSARYQLRRYKVSAAKESFETGGETYPAGSWIIPHKRGLKGLLSQIATDFMISFHALDSMPEVPVQEVDLPRIALYHNWISTQNDGWVRFSLDQAGIPYDYIADYTIRTANLRGKYDVIIVAHQGGASSKAMLIGRDPKFGPQSYVPSDEFPSHGFVDNARDITGGLGYQGLENLETFLNKGGTLLMLGSSGSLATDFGLVRNVSRSAGRVNTPGSSIQTKIIRRDHPIAYGFDEVTHVFRTNGPLYSVPKRFDHWVVMQYGTKPMRDDEEEKDEEESTESSGESEGEEKEEEPKKDNGKFLLSGYVDNQASLEKQAAILDIPRNAGGRVVLYSFNPMHRHLNHGDHNFVFNALLYWNDYPEPIPKDHEGLVKD
jgi:hypothetical protein